jgi:hypothetical protein
MKWAITLTWSKMMATVIFLAGLVISLMLIRRSEIDSAVKIFSTCTAVSAGLLGWRQAANAVKSLPTTLLNGLKNDDRVSDEHSEVSVTDP